MSIHGEISQRVDSFLTELTQLSHKYGIGINILTSEEDPRPSLFLLDSDEDKDAAYFVNENDGLYFE